MPLRFRPLSIIVIFITLLTSCDTGTEPIGVETIEVIAPTGVIVVGASAELTAILLDDAGDPLNGGEIEWSSDAPSIAQVDGAGVVTGISVGTAQITARSEGKGASVTMTVGAPVQSIVVWPDTALMLVDGTRELELELYTAPNVSTTGRDVVWSSDDSEIVSVDSAGVLTSQAEGQTTITATVEGKSASTEVYVIRYESPLVFDTVAAGEYWHACGLTQDGKAYCWGDNRVGQLGVDRPMDRCRPHLLMAPTPFRCTTIPLPVSGDHAFSSLALGDEFSCGLTASGEAYCWGTNVYGQLGNGESGAVGGSVAMSTEPVAVLGGHKFRALSAGSMNTCGITISNETYCWGSNRWGVLGDTGLEKSSVPVRVGADITLEKIDVGLTQVCGLDAEGRAYCWGDSRDGVLGTSDTTAERIYEPTLVETELTFASIVAADHSSCALTDAGAAYCWGVAWGLGSGATTVQTSPTRVAGGSTYVALTAGHTTCGIVEDGSAECWGYTTHEIPGGLSWNSVSAGSLRACGIATDGYAYCWRVAATEGEAITEPAKVKGQ